MKTVTRLGFLSIVAVALGLFGAGTAWAWPPTFMPEPGGYIQINPVSPNETWICNALSPSLPLVESTGQGWPGDTKSFKFDPGAWALIGCSGTGWPIIYYGPLMQAGR